MVLWKNRVIGVRGHGSNREFFIDGKCDECGAVLSADWGCFLVASKQNLKRTLQREYLCERCSKNMFLSVDCPECGLNCSDEEREECYGIMCAESDIACGCPL